VLDPGLIREAVAVQVGGTDLVPAREAAWVPVPQVEEHGSVGMGGVGGSAGWLDAGSWLAVGYVPDGGRLDRVDHIEAALAECLAAS